MSWWLRRDEIDSKKECFGIFRADNNPAKWEVNRNVHTGKSTFPTQPKTISLHLLLIENFDWPLKNNNCFWLS